MKLLFAFSLAVLCTFNLVNSKIIETETPKIASGSKLRHQFFPVHGSCFTFKVRTKMDAIVCLTSAPKAADPIIEIVIGGDINRRSFIRRNWRGQSFIILNTPGILHASEYRGFWIRWSSGRVIVGREGEAVGFISYKPPHLHPINFIGISSWIDASAKWIIDTGGNGYDCQGPKYDRINNRMEIETPAKFHYQFFRVSGSCFTFKVRSIKDALVCLTSVPKAADPIIEIEIGSGNNSKSLLRENWRSEYLGFVDTPGILNASEFRGFWIRWSSGLVNVGREGEAVGFISFKPPHLHPINFIGISSWNGASAKWIIDTSGNAEDCQAPKYDSINNRTEIETPAKFHYQFFPVSGSCFTFKVRSIKDALVCLTSVPKAADPIIEIEIGSGNNSKSLIRENWRSENLGFVDTPGILHASEFRGFWIRWSSGLVNVGREGEAVGFISYKPPHLHPINLIGISSWNDTSAKWIIDTGGNGDDCQAPKYDSINNRTEIETPAKFHYQFFPVSGSCFTFKVRSIKDTLVCLTSAPKAADPIIEIEIGSGNNRKSLIRENWRSENLGSVNTPGILHASEFRGFWIRWSSGLVIVGREGEAVGFISYKPPHLHPINFIGISSWNGASAKWIIDTSGNAEDCQAPKYDSINNRTEIVTPAKFQYQFFPVSGSCFTFKVRSIKDALVCLTSAPKAADPIIEIEIGSGNNSKSLIRENWESENLGFVDTPGILHPSEFRGFWIRWSSGLVNVGREGEAVGFISYKPPHLHPINFIGISSWCGASAKWIIDTGGNGDDCKALNNPPQTGPVGRTTSQTEKGTYSPVMTNSTIEIQTPDKFQYQFFQVSGACVTFKVRASNDVRLSLTAGPEGADPMAEIIIGGWANTQSVIRKYCQKPDVGIVPTPGILDAGEFRGFWIRWYPGVVTVGREGEAASFMSLADPHLHPIHFMGISTGWCASGSWIIDNDGADCKALNNPPQTGPVGRTTSQTEKGTYSPVMTNSTIEIQTPDKFQYQFFQVSGACVSFKVRASNDVRLSLTAGQEGADPMAEIIIGGWANTQSVIRKYCQKPDVGIVPTPGILDAGEFRGFWIRWYPGVVTVGRKGEAASFMSLADPHLHPIHFIGISTGWCASGSWIIDNDGDDC